MFTMFFQIIKDCHEENVDSQLCDSSNIDVSNYLKIASSDNHDPFCLVVTMTYRDFSDGVLGLAWVADINSKFSSYQYYWSKALVLFITNKNSEL